MVIPYILSKPKIGDVIVLQHPTKHPLLIKRIRKIENNTYWVEGDNKIRSMDSRAFGFVSRKQIIGKAKVFHRY